jgi:hypothetical protein
MQSRDVLEVNLDGAQSQKPASLQRQVGQMTQSDLHQDEHIEEQKPALGIFSRLENLLCQYQTAHGEFGSCS